jgi:hypothetical protein
MAHDPGVLEKTLAIGLGEPRDAPEVEPRERDAKALTLVQDRPPAQSRLE